MTVEFHGPWLTLITALPLVAAGVIGTWRSTTWRWVGSSLIAGLTLGLAILAWIDLNLLGAWSACDAWELIG
ncbi:MAG TPA: hypothetical protein PKD54_10745, partial [Pirellulaceae bacterium]|nr:hypothetical protein [Pirellulaceae bacterium]